MADSSSETAWYSVRVKGRSEFRVSNELTARGFEPFLPVHRVTRHWSDRLKSLKSPLFPGYVFCRFHPSSRVRVLTTPGVAHIVGYGHTPIPVSEAEIASIRKFVESGVVLASWPYLHSGQRVHIQHGPLAGVQGTVVRAENGKARIVVSVDLLRRAISAEVDREWVEGA